MIPKHERESERSRSFCDRGQVSAREQASVMAAALLLFVMRNNEERREREGEIISSDGRADKRPLWRAVEQTFPTKSCGGERERV